MSNTGGGAEKCVDAVVVAVVDIVVDKLAGDDDDDDDDKRLEEQGKEEGSVGPFAVKRPPWFALPSRFDDDSDPGPLWLFLLFPPCFPLPA